MCDRYLYGFEEYCRSAGITFRTVHHNDPRPVVTPSEPQKAVKQEPSDAREPSGPPVTDKPAANEDDSEDENEKAHKGTSPRVRGAMWLHKTWVNCTFLPRDLFLNEAEIMLSL